MKRENLKRTRNVLVAAALLPAMFAVAFSADDPGVVPVNKKTFGMHYGEWTVAYWQWALGIPYDSNPWANDYTGEFAGVGQSGPVWFLGGTLGDDATRTFTMPADKHIFMPINQWIFGSAVFDCDPSAPGVPCDVPTLRAAAEANADQTFNMAVSIDGNPISNPSNYRAVSKPQSFSVTLPEGGVMEEFGGVGAGTYAPQVSDGYWLMLTPLAVGKHEILVHAESTLGFVYDITYNITVE